MHIRIDSQTPVQLTRNKKLLVDENDLPERIKNKPGVYFFSRKFGAKFEPFYIGEALGIRGRFRAHLKAKNIAFILLDIDPRSQVKGGVRYFHFGYVGNSKRAGTKKRLRIVQRYLIRAAIERGVTLINKQLVTVRTHSLSLKGSKKARALFAKSAEVERY